MSAVLELSALLEFTAPGESGRVSIASAMGIGVLVWARADDAVMRVNARVPRRVWRVRLRRKKLDERDVLKMEYLGFAGQGWADLYEVRCTRRI
jgi:hypothetical protein